MSNFARIMDILNIAASLPVEQRVAYVDRESSIPPQATQRIPEAIDRLIALESARGDATKAGMCQAERAKYPSAVSAK